MKSKAKPAKGSARTKRFDVGGTVGALAGLGTLAYLLSRKKKGDAESGGMSKDPNAPSVMDRLRDKADTTTDTTSDNKPFVKPPPGVIFEEDRAKEKDRMDSAVKTHRDITSGGGGGNAPVVRKKPVVKKPVDKSTADAAPKAATNTAPKAVTNIAPKAVTNTAPKAVPNAGTSKDGLGKVKQIGEDSPAAKTMRESRAQRLGTTYNAQYKALQTAPEGPGKEALKKSVAKAKADYDAAVKGLRKGGMVKKYASGGSVMASKMGSVKTAKPSMRSASSRADGIAQRGKTRA